MYNLIPGNVLLCKYPACYIILSDGFQNYKGAIFSGDGDVGDISALPADGPQ